jgi:hypothetical protein
LHPWRIVSNVDLGRSKNSAYMLCTMLRTHHQQTPQTVAIPSHERGRCNKAYRPNALMYHSRPEPIPPAQNEEDMTRMCGVAHRDDAWRSANSSVWRLVQMREITCCRVNWNRDAETHTTKTCKKAPSLNIKTSNQVFHSPDLHAVLYDDKSFSVLLQSLRIHHDVSYSPTGKSRDTITKWLDIRDTTVQNVRQEQDP